MTVMHRWYRQTNDGQFTTEQQGALCYLITQSQFYCQQHIVHKREVLPEPQGPYSGADLRFLSPHPDTSLHCQTSDMGLVHRAVCLFTSQFALVLIASTHGGMARLSWPGCHGYIRRRHTCERSPISVLTWLSVGQPPWWDQQCYCYTEPATYQTQPIPLAGPHIREVDITIQVEHRHCWRLFHVIRRPTSVSRPAVFSGRLSTTSTTTWCRRVAEQRSVSETFFRRSQIFRQCHRGVAVLLSRRYPVTSRIRFRSM